MGVPVWASVRPIGALLSVNSGKGFSDDVARAGAIAEAIEFASLEHTVRDSSNGWALGADYEDALIQGIFEVVERDAVTIWTHRWKNFGRNPPKAPFIFESWKELKRKCESADLRLLLFYCTLDINLPVFWATLVDPYSGLESFGGWGCHLSTEEAGCRAILESIQSRAVIIAGARDDLDRRNIDFLRSLDFPELIKNYDALPPERIPLECFDRDTYSTLTEVLDRLGPWMKHIRTDSVDLGDFVAVGTVIEGLEPPITQTWKPGERCIQFSSLDQP